MLYDVFDDLINEISSALAYSHKDCIIANIIETASQSGEIDIRDAVFNTVSDSDMDDWFQKIIIRNTNNTETCVKIIIDYGIQRAMKLWVEHGVVISSENIPSESDIALKILSEDYQISPDYIFDKIVEYLMCDEDVMNAIEKCKNDKSTTYSGIDRFVKDINDGCRLYLSHMDI